MIATEQHYKIADVAKLLSVSRFTVRRWIEDGTLDAVDVNPRSDGRAAWRVRQSTLNELLERMANNRPPRRKRKTGTAVKPIHSTASQAAAKSPAKRRTLRPKRQYV